MSQAAAYMEALSYKPWFGALASGLTVAAYLVLLR